ncbi:hypothetical protein O6H91_07G033900 [Diphasiastrum complanatum]|uniref:Uncharacterized protein n=1 Tax=Diphasiastrum complanatum TaxID=34168 RepID=A0ACC2D3T4_DIPCM|nr:hypothetical protein O6H91_07G033900 [Diphasiastrum complanatum]
MSLLSFCRRYNIDAIAALSTLFSCCFCNIKVLFCHVLKLVFTSFVDVFCLFSARVATLFSFSTWLLTCCFLSCICTVKSCLFLCFVSEGYQLRICRTIQFLREGERERCSSKINLSSRSRCDYFH